MGWAQQPKGQSQPPAVTLRPHQPVCDYGRSGAQERFFSVINFNAIRFQKSESARSYPSFLTTPRARPGLEKPLNSPRRTPCAASAHLLSAHAVGGTPVAARASVKRHAGEACECHSKATLQPIPRPHHSPFQGHIIGHSQDHSHPTPWPLSRRRSHASSASCGDLHGVISLTRRGACTLA